MEKGSSGPGRAPCAQRGNTRGTAPQVCTSIPPTPHTAVQATSGFCLPGRTVISYLVAPILLGSTPGWVVPEYKGVALPLHPTHPAGPCCPRREGSLSAPQSYMSYDQRGQQ